MKRKKIKYVSLESGAFISDLIFQVMNAAERGVYCTLLFYLYENDGRMPFDIELLKGLCNCDDFEKAWEFIKQKFTVKNGNISQKRVTAELNRAKKISQAQTEKAVKAANARWNDDATSMPQASNKHATSKAKEGEDKSSEAKQSEDKPGDNTNSSDPPDNQPLTTDDIESDNESLDDSHFNSLSSSPQLATTLITAAAEGATNLELDIIRFYDKLAGTFGARTPSDTTSLRNLSRWVKDKINQGRFNREIIPRILDMAAESKEGNSIKPIAVFFARVNKELKRNDDN